MTLVLLTPERDHPHEHAVLAELFAGGLERCHVRKPHALRGELATWIECVPAQWRSRLVLHQHHELAAQYGVGGLHWSEVGRASARHAGADASEWRAEARPTTSTSCHDLVTLRTLLGRFDSVFFGPLFPSVSKPGYGPRLGSGVPSHPEITAFLAARPTSARSTMVVALGGITADTAAQALALGFDGVAVLGAVWQAADPVAAFNRIRTTVIEVGRGLRSASFTAGNGVPALPTEVEVGSGVPALTNDVVAGSGVPRRPTATAVVGAVPASTN